MCVLDDAQQRVPWWRRWVNLTGPGLVSVAEVLEAGRTGPGVEPHGVSGAVVKLGGGGGQQGHGAPLVGLTQPFGGLPGPTSGVSASK